MYNCWCEISGRNVKQQINMTFCDKIAKYAIEKLTLSRKKNPSAC